MLVKAGFLQTLPSSDVDSLESEVKTGCEQQHIHNSCWKLKLHLSFNHVN